MKVFNSSIFLVLFTLSAVAQNPSSLLKKLSRLPQDTSRVLLLKEISSYYKDTNSDSAILFAQNGLQLSVKLNYTYGKAAMNALLGKYTASQGKTGIAKMHFNTAMALFEQLKNQPGIAMVDNELGIIAAKEGSLNKATTYFLKALKIHQAANDTTGIVQSYIKLGTVNDISGDQVKALEYFKKGVALSKRLPVSNATGTLLNNIGIIYGKQNKMPLAIQYFLEGLKVTKDPAFSQPHLLLLINLGSAYASTGNLKAAYFYEKTSLKLLRERHLPDQEANALINLGNLLALTKPDTSAVLLQQAIAITQRIGLPTIKLDAYMGLMTLNKNTGNYKKALEILEKHDVLQDSLFTLKKAKDLASLQANYDLANETVKTQRLQLKNNRVVFTQKIIVFISSAILSLFIISMVFFARTKRLNKELIRQKEELNRLNNFKDKLFSIIGHDLRSPISNILNMLDVFDQDILSAEEIHALAPALKDQSLVTLEVLDKLLLWGKSHLKGVVLHQSNFNVTELIRKNLKLYTNIAADKQLTLVDDVPDVLMLYADATHVDFVIRNLLANAVKYSFSGGKIELFAATDQHGDQSTFVIRDFGTGIAKEFQQKIFDIDNLSMAGTANEAGNSIGLMLCKEFVLENHGTLKLKSEVGRGTEFHVSFPSAR